MPRQSEASSAPGCMRGGRGKWQCGLIDLGPGLPPRAASLFVCLRAAEKNGRGRWDYGDYFGLLGSEERSDKGVRRAAAGRRRPVVPQPPSGGTSRA